MWECISWILTGQTHVFTGGRRLEAVILQQVPAGLCSWRRWRCRTWGLQEEKKENIKGGSYKNVLHITQAFLVGFLSLRIKQIHRVAKNVWQYSMKYNVECRSYGWWVMRNESALDLVFRDVSFVPKQQKVLLTPTEPWRRWKCYLSDLSNK